MPDGKTVAFAMVGDWRIGAITLSQFESLASIKKKINFVRNRNYEFHKDGPRDNEMFLYQAKRRSQWISLNDPMLTTRSARFVPDDIEDVVCDANLLDDETVRRSDFLECPPDALGLLVVYLKSSEEVALSTWTPPTAMTAYAQERIHIETIQAPVTCECCESERTPIFTTDVVSGVFVKLERLDDSDSTLVATRTQTNRMKATDVVAISYAWGTLPHDQLVTVRVTDVCEIGETDIDANKLHPNGVSDKQKQSNVTLTLSSEWDAAKVIARLVALSNDAWLWIDQLCLPQDGELSSVLSTSISAIYSSCRVCCLVATLPCADFDELQRATTSLQISGEHEQVTALLESHMRTCECTANWNVYFSRIWPWQEFAIATKIEFYTGLGLQNVAPRGGSIHTLDTAMNQVAFKLAERIWGGTFDTMTRDNREAAVLLLLGWGVRSSPRKKIATIDTLNFLGWLARSQRAATKMLDMFFAVAPLLELASDFQLSSAMSVRDALVTVTSAFQYRNAVRVSGAVPLGVIGCPSRSYQMLLTVFDFLFESMQSTYDLLPFIAPSSRTCTVKGIVRGYPAPRTITTLLRRGQTSHASLRAIVRSMSRAQKEQAKEFIRGPLWLQMEPTCAMVAGALAGKMDSAFTFADINLSSAMEAAEYNRMLFCTVAAVLGFFPFHSMMLADELSESPVLACVPLTDQETALAIVNEQSYADHVCVSGNATYVGKMTADGTRFRVTGTVLGAYCATMLCCELIHEGWPFPNSTVIE